MIAKAPQTLQAFFDTVYRPLRMIDAGPRAAQQYEVAINRFSAYLGHDATLDDLTEAALAGWMQAGRKGGLAHATVNSRRRMIVTLWRFAKAKRYVDRGGDDDLAMVEPLRAPRRLPEAWTIDEMERLLASCRMAHGRFSGIAANRWWPALVLVMYDTGLRRSAVLAIQFEEIDFGQKLLRVPAERMKNFCEQWFRLSDQCLAAILDTLPPRRRLLFPWPFTHHRALYGRFKTILRRAGLPEGRRDMFHKIRRTTASHIAAAAGKGTAFQQLGHRDASCIDRYVDPRFTSGHDASKFLPRPGWVIPAPVIVETKEPKTKPEAEPLTYRFTRDELRGGGADVFARLAATERLRDRDVADALECLGIRNRDFAAELGINARYLGQILRGRAVMSAKLESRIRQALGLTHGRDGEAGKMSAR